MPVESPPFILPYTNNVLWRSVGCWSWSCSLAAQAADISYSRDIQQIFTQSRVACHACCDAPCQLNLDSAERGASKVPVYDGTRSETQATTRLFIDAHGEPAWRRRAFIRYLINRAAKRL